MHTAVQVSNDSPVLLDSFLDHAIEVDIDVISDGEDVVIGGINSNSCSICEKRSRSSAKSIALGLVPIIFAPLFSKAAANLSGVCPP
jgi:hypothetical protein